MGQKQLFDTHEPSTPSSGPVAVFNASWIIDDRSNTVVCHWSISDGHTGDTLAHGITDAQTVNAWEFGEAGWLVRRLRDTKLRCVPFP